MIHKLRAKLVEHKLELEDDITHHMVGELAHDYVMGQLAATKHAIRELDKVIREERRS